MDTNCKVWSLLGNKFKQTNYKINLNKLIMKQHLFVAVVT